MIVIPFCYLCMHSLHYFYIGETIWWNKAINHSNIYILFDRSLCQFEFIQVQGIFNQHHFQVVLGALVSISELEDASFEFATIEDMRSQVSLGKIIGKIHDDFPIGSIHHFHSAFYSTCEGTSLGICWRNLKYVENKSLLLFSPCHLRFLLTMWQWDSIQPQRKKSTTLFGLKYHQGCFENNDDLVSSKPMLKEYVEHLMAWHDQYKCGLALGPSIQPLNLIIIIHIHFIGLQSSITLWWSWDPGQYLEVRVQYPQWLVSWVDDIYDLVPQHKDDNAQHHFMSMAHMSPTFEMMICKDNLFYFHRWSFSVALRLLDGYDDDKIDAGLFVRKSH